MTNPHNSQSNGETISLLQKSDWNEEWKRLQRIRRRADDAQYWNKRSKNFSSKDSPSPYVSEFLKMASVQPGERVLDMGCGTGSIAVPLALAGNHVIAADFSQGMLDETAARVKVAEREHDAHIADRVETKLMSWDDNWNEHGMGAHCVDVAIASRSIATHDLRQALMKLNHVASRRCCVTLTTGCSPRMDRNVLSAIGVRNRHGNDAQYAWNILTNDGFEPTYSYIRSTRLDTFDDLADAAVDFGRMITDTLDENDTEGIAQAKRNLETWLQDNLVPNEHVGKPDSKGIPQKALRLRNPRIITWAFISWETK